MSSGWSVDLKGASTATLVELYELLKKSKESRSQAHEIQKELVERAKAVGLTTQEIVNALVAGGGVPSGVEIEKWRILPVGSPTTNRPSGKTAAGGMRHGEAYQEVGAAA